jgi:hypothetical protein
MIRGQRHDLSPQQQVDIAAWASKTVVAPESHEPSALVTLAEDRDLIRTERRPPAHYRVRLACRDEVHEPLLLNTRVGRSDDPVGEEPDVIATLLCLGFLLVQVWGGHGDAGSGLARAGTNNGRALMIWPPTLGLLTGLQRLLSGSPISTTSRLR